MRKIILALGITGFVLFASALVASFASPGFVERVAQEVIRIEVEKRVHEKIEALDASFLSKKAAALSQGYADDIARAKQLIAEQAPARIAATIAEMRNLSCECRKNIEANIKWGLDFRIATGTEAQERLTTLIRSKYMETAAQLTREFRIFTGTNALVFALLIAAVLIRRQAGAHLLPAAIVLLTAAALTGYAYLFNQNWLHTLVFSDYVGFGYLAYLGAAFALLCDIIFNYARVTVRMLNVFFNIVGAAASLSPC